MWGVCGAFVERFKSRNIFEKTKTCRDLVGGVVRFRNIHRMRNYFYFSLYQ